MFRFLANVNTFILFCDVIFFILYFWSIFNNLSEGTIQRAKLIKKKPDFAGFLGVILALLLVCFIPVINIIFLYLFVSNFTKLRDEAVDNITEMIEKEFYE